MLGLNRSGNLCVIHVLQNGSDDGNTLMHRSNITDSTDRQVRVHNSKHLIQCVFNIIVIQNLSPDPPIKAFF